MPRSVVCGVDWSDESIAAAEVAATLSKRLDATLVLAHVVDGSGVFPYGSESERQRHRTHSEASRGLERLRSRFSTLDVAERVLRGAPAEELADLAEEEDAVLLVVGSRGRGAVKAALFGSVSSALARAADRPVVIARPDARLPTPQATRDRPPIVCGVDDSPQARGAAGVAAKLAAALGAELVLVHVYSPARSAATIPAGGVAPPIDHEALEARQRRAAEALLTEAVEEVTFDAPVKARLEAGRPASELESCAREESAELIVVGTHGRGPLASALLGSTSAALAAGGPVPVVMVSERAALRATGAAARDDAK
jgi:nucleotide-binding universal stress UspA family protein